MTENEFDRQWIRSNVRTGPVAIIGEAEVFGAEKDHVIHTKTRQRRARMPTRTFLYADVSTYIFLYRYICIHARLRRVCVYMCTHRGRSTSAGAHIIAGIHNADVFMALTRLFLVRWPPPTYPAAAMPVPVMQPQVEIIG